ncbi:DUF5640 domain-containing protein [Desulforhabdus sp. TSK]|uniref:DUF5640 domain-containing protein n=1 Tax=Desulforhabdus sp. TSK TaxID=2925014 RepID=UPI001FC7F4BB|nr:DUF5640 domain-containing protein [Desulforhabdus sp. TSK]GKT09049.1 hypothetical protein DSTSK_23540 [Desulforhabdus sp. TSK]
MKAVRLCVVLCFALLLASCSLKPNWDLMGKWQKVDGTEMLEFTGKGTVALTDGPISINTTYKLVDGKLLQINVGSLGAVELKVSIAQNTMTLTDSRGQVTTFKKAR